MSEDEFRKKVSQRAIAFIEINHDKSGYVHAEDMLESLVLPDTLKFTRKAGILYVKKHRSLRN